MTSINPVMLVHSVSIESRFFRFLGRYFCGFVFSWVCRLLQCGPRGSAPHLDCPWRPLQPLEVLVWTCPQPRPSQVYSITLCVCVCLDPDLVLVQVLDPDLEAGSTLSSEMFSLLATPGSRSMIQQGHSSGDLRLPQSKVTHVQVCVTSASAGPRPPDLDLGQTHLTDWLTVV